MKKLIFISVIVLLNTLLFAQSPNAFKYQAVVRDASGASICNADVSLKFSVRQGSAAGTIVYEETHSPTTNDFGLVNLEIGNGTIVSGNFSTIKWESDIYFITVALDITGGTNYQEMGTEQLFSVPYAMHSTTAEFIDDADADPTNELQTLSQNGNIVTLSNNGGTITVDDGDSDDSNELQTLSQNGTTVTLSQNGGSITVEDDDPDPTNECQQLSINGNTLSISPCGNSVTLPNGGLTLPYSGTCSIGTAAFFIENTGSGYVCDLKGSGSGGTSTTLRARKTGNSGYAAEILIDNSSNNSDALVVGTNGFGNAIFAYTPSGTGAFAGYFDGDLYATSASSGIKAFKIDHPLDPENKYLYHSSVESSDMMNVYNGNVTLNNNGAAIVELPEWFNALNKDFRYQLTCIGGYAPVYVAEEIANNSFKISGGTPGIKVSWQVTGIRKDPLADKNRIQVEVEKIYKEKGHYLHYKAYNQPIEKSIQVVKNPDLLKELENKETK